jgi:hypothetical protein
MARFFDEIKALGDVKGLQWLSSRERMMFHREAERQGFISFTAGRTLVIGKDREDVKRAMSQLKAEAATAVEARQARWQAERGGDDRLHQQVVESGENGEITGTWQVKLPKRRSWGSHREHERWYIAGSDDSGNVWATSKIRGTSGVVRIDCGEHHSGWNTEEKTFVWRDMAIVDPEQETLEYRLLGGSVVFTSANTCTGVWEQGRGRKYEFTGRKLGQETGASVEKCKKEFGSATKRAREYMESQSIRDSDSD